MLGNYHASPFCVQPPGIAPITQSPPPPPHPPPPPPPPPSPPLAVLLPVIFS